MSKKLYSVSIKYNIIEEHQIRANSLKEAEDEIIRMAQNLELLSGNIYDSEIDEVDDIVCSHEVKESKSL